MEFAQRLRSSFGLAVLAGTQIIMAAFGVLLVLAPQPAVAVQSVPYKINFQGRLTDNNGNILSDGSYNIKFRLFDAASGGTNRWEGDRVYGTADNRVSVQNGLFNIQFGDTSKGDPALSPSLFNTQTYANLYLEVELPTPATATCASNSCAVFTEGAMTPRQALASATYAFNSDTLDGLDSTNFVQLNPAGTQTGNVNIDGVIQAASSTLSGANALTLGSTANAGTILFQDGTSNNRTVTLSASGLTASYQLYLPTNAPSTSQCLQTDALVAAQLKFGSCSGSGSGDLQAAYNNSTTPATITLADAKDLVLAAPDTATTDPSILVNLQCASCSSNGGRFAVQVAGADVFTVSPSTGNILVKPASDTPTAFQVKTNGNTDVLTVDTTNNLTSVRSKLDNATVGSDLFAANYASCSGTNWAVGASSATHTAGSSLALVCTSPTITTGATYELTFTTASTADSTTQVTPNIGGANGAHIYGNASGSLNRHIITAGSTASLQFTPDANWSGTISSITVKLVTNSKAALAARDSSGATQLEVRATANNLALGYQSLQSVTSSIAWNTALGYQALQSDESGWSNTAIGHQALQVHTQNDDNTAIGDQAMQQDLTGYNNTAIGYRSLNNNVNGYNNTAVGYQALGNNVSGTYLAALGYGAGTIDGENFATLKNLQYATAIGARAQVQASNSLVLGPTGSIAVNVGIGTTSPTNTFSVSPVQYSTGTAGTAGLSSTTVTGSGTSWTSAMVGSEIIFTDGTKRTITAVGGPTTLTVASAVTIANGTNYRIQRPALQVTNAGLVGIGTVAPTANLQVLAQTDTATALLVQSAAGASVLTVATDTPLVRVGDTTNGITLAVSGGLTYSGTAQPIKRVTLAPEYPDVTFTPDGTNNSGTLTSDFCANKTAGLQLNTAICATAGDKHSFYSWTTVQATAQDYDLYVQYQIPSDFSALNANNTVTMYGWRSTANDSVTLSLYKADITQCGADTTVTTTNGQWSSATLDTTGCTFAPNDIVTFKIHLTATSGNYARAGEIYFDYKRKN